jgi:hypothetical protein
LCDSDGISRVSHSAQKNRKLVAAEACERVDRTQCAFETFCKSHEEQVTMCVAQTIVDVLETIEVEKEDCKLVIVATARAFNLSLEQLGEHGTVRQARQRIVEGRVAEVILCLFKDAADAFLLRDVIVQFMNVSFGLFSTLVFELRACAFSFFRVSCGGFNFAHVSVVAEVDDDDDRNADEKRPEASCAETVDDKSGACGSCEITDRHPKKVASPHSPD